MCFIFGESSETIWPQPCHAVDLPGGAKAKRLGNKAYRALVQVSHLRHLLLSLTVLMIAYVRWQLTLGTLWSVIAYCHCDILSMHFHKAVMPRKQQQRGVPTSTAIGWEHCLTKWRICVCTIGHHRACAKFSFGFVTSWFGSPGPIQILSHILDGCLETSASIFVPLVHKTSLRLGCFCSYCTCLGGLVLEPCAPHVLTLFFQSYATKIPKGACQAHI